VASRFAENGEKIDTRSRSTNDDQTPLLYRALKLVKRHKPKQDVQKSQIICPQTEFDSCDIYREWKARFLTS